MKRDAGAGNPIFDSSAEAITDLTNQDAECARMQSKLIIICACLVASVVIAQSDNVPSVSVKELPPQKVPTGTCTASASGYVGIIEKNGKERNKMTPQEIGKYVEKRVGQGYILTLYPQPGDRIFAIAECPSKNSREGASL